MVSHPLEPLSSDEIARVARILHASGQIGERPSFAWIALDEPTKAELSAASAARRAIASTVDRATGTSFESVVDLGSGTIVRADALIGLHAPLTWDEFDDAHAVLALPKVVAALAKRGVADPTTVVLEPWPAGNFGRSYDDSGKRLVHCVFYVKDEPGDQPWARPVQGLVAVWDRTAGELIELLDDGSTTPPPNDPGRFDAETVGTMRNDLEPLDIVQPDGPSFELQGHLLSWQRWSMRLSMHPIEGLVLHQISYDDPAAGRSRSILHRASMAEMCVPYGDAQTQHFWRHVFDEGEVGMGRTANSLKLGCDCLGEIRYLDAPMVLNDGSVTVVENAICIHEEDAGILWRHFDRDANTAHVRRNRRLVVSYWATLGNYDYGYYWSFYQDGSIELEVRLTGIVLASATTEGQQPSPSAAKLTPTLEAPHHQHFFSFRLDFDVDGVANRVDEVDVVALGEGPDNPHGSAFAAVITTLATESAAQRVADPLAGRRWRVVNPAVTNQFGDPVGYEVTPGASPLLLASADSAAGRRAGFAAKHLWVTPYRPDEMRAAGAYPTQHGGGAGLPAMTAGDRHLDGEDVVLWLTVGANHVARPEEWPVMPVERVGFQIRPVGFFDRNPALDVAPQDLVNPDGAHCH